MPQISLCMIVRNEEALLGKCLKSVRSVADELIIVDTGSTDNTIAIAQSFGAHVYQIEWRDDFSYARNKALGYAMGDWILILDADETLQDGAHEAIQTLIRQASCDAYFFRLVSYFGKQRSTDMFEDARICLFRNNVDFYYEGAIHEEIAPSIERNGKLGICHSNITVYHDGYLDEIVAKKRKTVRNTRIIEKELGQSKEKGRMLYALGTEYMQQEQFEKALRSFLRAEARWNRTDPHYSDCLYKIALTFKALGRLRESNLWINVGLYHFPQYTDLVFLKGAVALERGEEEKAIEAFERCLRLGTPPTAFYSLQGVGSFRAHEALGIVYEKKGDMLRALSSYMAALKLEPQDQLALQRVITLGASAMNREAFLSFCDEHFDLRDQATLEQLSFMLCATEQYALSIALFEKAVRYGVTPSLFRAFSSFCERVAVLLEEKK